MSIVAIPYTFTNGLPLDATWLNANFQALAGGLGSGLANAALTNITATTLTLGTLSFADTGIIYGAQGALNGYVQNVVQNTSNGSAASADIIVSNNLGTAGTYYGDLGINSSTFSGAGSLSLPNATYLYASNGDLVLGTYTANSIHFVVGNGATDAAAIDVNGNFTANITGPLTGSTQRTLGSKLGDIASVKDFGAKGDGSTDDTAALAAARSWLASAAAPATLVFPQGVYVYSLSPNWAVNNASIVALGRVTLQYTGTGNAVIVDGGSSSTAVYNMRMGPFIVNAPSTALDGVYIRAAHHSDFEFNVRGCGASNAGMRVIFSVCSVFKKPTCSNNEGGFYLGATPGYGLYLDQRGAGETVSYCLFEDPVFEGVGVGAYLNYGLGNSFVGGTMEGCATYGMYVTANSRCNKTWGTDLESNGTADIYDLGYDNEYHGVNSGTTSSWGSTATRNKILGGSFNSIVCSSGSTRNIFSGVTYNRYSTGSITDSGTYNSFATCTNPSVAYLGKSPVRSVLSVGASPYTYYNTSGDIIEVLVSGAGVSGITYYRGGTGDTVSYVTGNLYTLRPGDALVVAYTVAPTMIAYL